MLSNIEVYSTEVVKILNMFILVFPNEKYYDFCSLLNLSSFQNRNTLKFCSNFHCFNIHGLMYMEENHMMEKSVLGYF